MSSSSSLNSVHASLASAIAYKRSPERIAELKHQLEVEKLKSHIERVVAAAPPLLPEQRHQLIRLLRDGGSRNG